MLTDDLFSEIFIFFLAQMFISIIWIFQISSVMEENNLLNETFQNSKKDLQTLIVQLEEQLKEQKSNEDALKAKLEVLNTEVVQKSELQNHLKELQEQLATAEAQLEEEVTRTIFYVFNNQKLNICCHRTLHCLYVYPDIGLGWTLVQLSEKKK